MAMVMARPAVTAEWQCTRCSTTNRKLVQVDTREVRDRCASCRTRHVVTPGDRPVRWNARPA
ncbi:MAG: hypothetical protein H6R40_292 [Gemmatimonadetes bacterium]|nr:hypothetical protein [Gemmatimonadota bacterium]